MELFEKTAAQLGKMLRTGECSAVEVTESVLGRIAAVEPKTKAYISITADEARAQAARVDAKLAAGEELAPLAGIPVAVKDNICTRGVRTTCASRMLESFEPPYDATVIERLKAQEFVMPGKANLDEFAMGGSCENSAFAKTCNPRDVSRVPGGSSGGSAAAVAAGEAVLALGSDTGGSIRQPAAFCGVVGLKPTYGAVSRYGLVAFASSLDQIGPMGRSVEDVALLHAAICGRDKLDATSVALKDTDFFSHMQQGVAGLTVGLPREYLGDGLDEDVKAAVHAAVKEYERAGAKVKEISLPSADYAISAYYVISSAEASSNLARFDGVKYGHRAKEYDGLIDMYERTRSEAFGAEVKRRIMLGTFVLSSGFYDAYYKRAKRLQQRILAEYAEAFSGCDVIATPTAPTTAYKLGENAGDLVKMYMGDVCTVTANIAGLPAISVPCGSGRNGMPVGLQLIGPRFSEPLLFRAARFYEDVRGGFGPVATL